MFNLRRFSNTKSSASGRLGPDHPDGLRKLQLGCGPHHLRDDWWNTDLRKFPGIDEQLDATSDWRWENQLEFIYAEHFIEHLDIIGAFKFAANSHRALKVGGRVRISTPSLEWVHVSHMSPQGEGKSVTIDETLRMNRAFYGGVISSSILKTCLPNYSQHVDFPNTSFAAMEKAPHPGCVI